MRVELKPEGILIDGQPVIVLSSSLFYFRVPRAQWRDRMIKIRQAGYNTLDVYFPWNYHEVSEGKWNFHGERDVAEFLHIAQDEGLWVIARPGPYICSEWDGGGLPAYLFTKPGLRLRDNDPRFLRYVGRWFDHILPILEPFQITQGGSVIALQLENELDFYDSQDRADYMEVLRDIARDTGIKVPLIACAGQGDLRGASGHVPGVLPTCNIYTSDNDPAVEQRAFHLYNRLQAHNLPLCVTETNRSHFFLRRLLSAGAKLIGPYLQASGVNFGFTQAVNNWGQPLAFMVSDYDFGGMIASDGTLREDYREAQLFSRLITAFGSGLAQSRPVCLPAGTLQGSLPAAEDGPFALQLADGGLLLALPNFTGESQSVRVQLGTDVFPVHSTLRVESGCCPLLPVDLDLARWGGQGKLPNARLAYATAEVILAQPLADGLALVLCAEGEAELALELPEGAIAGAKEPLKTTGMEASQQGQRLTLHFTTGSAKKQAVHAATLRFADGRRLILFGVDRASAVHASVDEQGRLVLAREAADAGRARTATREIPATTWHSHPLTERLEAVEFHPAQPGPRAPFLEEMGILRGYGWYRGQVSELGSSPVRGYLLERAADVLSLYANNCYIATVTPGGGSAYLLDKSTDPVDTVRLEIRAEIWGHSNFDDSRLPALRLDAMRGLSSVVAVLRERDITPNWYMHQLDQAENKDLYTAQGLETDDWPLVSFAGWLSTRSPNQVCYLKHVMPGQGLVDRWVLSFPGLTRPVEVSVNGSHFERVTPLDPFLDISEFARPGQPLQLAVYAEQDYHGQLAGRVLLLEGKSAEGWEVGGIEEEGLWRVLSAASESSDEGARPVGPGELSVLWADLPPLKGDAVLRFQGKNAKLSVFFNGHLVGRIWLEMNRPIPRLAGGAPDQAFLPACWDGEAGSRVTVLVEAVDPAQPGTIETIEWI